MYLLYVDESDTSSDETARLLYCVCGLRCIDTSYGATVERLTKLIARWEPALPANFEIKGSDLYHGRGRGADARSTIDPRLLARWQTCCTSRISSCSSG